MIVRQGRLKIIFISFILLLAVLLPVAEIISPMNRRPVTMDFSEFTAQLKDKGIFKVTFSGKDRKSFFTDQDHLHYETIACYGSNHTSCQILYYTESELTVRHGNFQSIVRYQRFRTRLDPSFKDIYRKGDLVSPASEKEKAIAKLLDEEGTEELLLLEYGLDKNITYNARIREESYLLPPEKKGKPQRRYNLVLEIFDSANPEDRELTPLYKNWTY
jgi:hypothetical protein